jgi:hypothetical protein
VLLDPLVGAGLDELSVELEDVEELSVVELLSDEVSVDLLGVSLAVELLERAWPLAAVR